MAHLGSLQDEILRATGGPALATGLASWFGRTSNESLQDAERRFLLAFPATSTGTNADLWFQYLRSLGHTGGIPNMKLQYWSGQP